LLLLSRKPQIDVGRDLVDRFEESSKWCPKPPPVPLHPRFRWLKDEVDSLLLKQLRRTTLLLLFEELWFERDADDESESTLEADADPLLDDLRRLTLPNIVVVVGYGGPSLLQSLVRSIIFWPPSGHVNLSRP